VLEGETYGPLEYRRFMALVEKLIRPRERARP
jgi:hypothetical protein